MTLITLKLIQFYQRFISPRKGFVCAHHSVYRGETCSNAVKHLIMQKGLFQALPDIKRRFKECSQAYKSLQTPRMDLPCALPCDIAVGDCGLTSAGSGASDSCLAIPCDLFLSISRTQQVLLSVSLMLLILFASYWYHGRNVGAIYLQGVQSSEKNNPEQSEPSLLQRIWQRQKPQVRIVLLADGEKYYSDIVKLESPEHEYQLKFRDNPPWSDVDELKIVDARLKLGEDLLVLGQILAEFKQPESRNTGQGFSYRMQRRWSFF